MDLFKFPFLVFLLAFLLLWAAAHIAARVFARIPKLEDDEKGDYDLILGATLTLLGLLIGFSFSMAVGRYDQRKNYEEEEANAIGTEYVRLDLLPAADAQKIQALMREYLGERIKFYEDRIPAQKTQLDARSADLQNEMWSAAKSAALLQPSPLSALVVSGMNDVLNRQGYTQAAWWNLIPVAAWALMVGIAVCSNLMIGFGARHGRNKRLLVVVPLMLALSFLLLADLDSPHGGLIRVHPQNLLSLQQSLK
jgi:hypothetical protein